MPNVGNVAVTFKNSTSTILTRSGYTQQNAVWNQTPPPSLGQNANQNVTVGYNVPTNGRADFSASYTMPNVTAAFTVKFEVLNQSTRLEWTAFAPNNHEVAVNIGGAAPNLTALVTFQ